MDNNDPVVLYRHMFNSSAEPLMDHASKLGINLRSKELLQSQPAKHAKVRKGSAQHYGGGGGPLMTHGYGPVSSTQRGTGIHPTPTYIHNVVIPLHTPTDITSPYPPSFMSYGHYNRTQSATGLPKNHKSSAVSYMRSSSRTQSAFDKYTTSSPRERSSTANVARNRKNVSGQVLRFEAEQDDLSKCRSRKLTSVVRPHQVDRMYYMSGTPLRLEARYKVEDEELQRLRELSRSRKKASYYGHGLRSEDENAYENKKIDPPKNPPSSSFGDIGNTPVELAPTHEITQVNNANRAEDLDSVSEGDLTGRKLDSHPSEEVHEIKSTPVAQDMTQQMENLNVQDAGSPTTQVETNIPSDNIQEQVNGVEADPKPEQEPNMQQLDDGSSTVNGPSVTDNDHDRNLEPSKT